MSPLPLPEKDIALLQQYTEEVVTPPPGYTDLDFGNPNEEANQVIDITLLPGVPGQRGPAGPTGATGATGNSWNNGIHRCYRTARSFRTIIYLYSSRC